MQKEITITSIEVNNKKIINIITGCNGCGKTVALKEIIQKYQQEKSLHYILLPIEHFKSFAEISKYNEPSLIYSKESKSFINLYKIINKLPENLDFIKKCNLFFKSFNLNIRLHEPSVEGGWLLFYNIKHTSKKTITLDDISNGEKTLFLIWLLIQCKRFDLLILDDFDVHLSEMPCIKYNNHILSICERAYIYLYDHCVYNDMQLFIATNKSINLTFLEKYIK